MSDTTRPMPGAGAGLPTFASDAPPPPTGASTGGMTPEQARHAIRLFEDSSEWRSAALNPNAPGRLALMEQRRTVYDAAYPETPPAASPPANKGELEAGLSNHMRYPPGTTNDDRAAFHLASRDGLTALGATVGEVGHFTMAATEVLRSPESFTPESAERAMRREWGEAYAGKLQAAQEAVKRLPPHVRTHLTETPIGNHPRVLALLAAAGLRMQGRR